LLADKEEQAVNAGLLWVLIPQNKSFGEQIAKGGLFMKQKVQL
jgi:hypothetical protein